MITAKVIVGLVVAIALMIAIHQLTNVIVVGRPDVVDGRTLLIGDALIELDGIDAPAYFETCASNKKSGPLPCGMLSAASLRKLTASNSVYCLIKGDVGSSKHRAMCYSGLSDVGANQVESGWARSSGGSLPRYVREQEKARREGVGLWKISRS